MKLLLTGDHLQKFCDIIGNFKYISESITFWFSDDGIHSQGMSSDHCSLYELTVNNEWFDEFEWENGKDMDKVSVATSILSKVIQTRQPSQYMVIEYDGKPDSITIKLASNTANSKNKEFPKEFSIPLIDIDVEKLNIPSDTEYSAEFGIGSKSLQVTNEQLSMFDETITVHCEEEEIYLQSKGIEGELKVTLFSSNCEHITEFAIEDSLRLTLDFSIKHFNTFCRFIKVSENVELSFKDGFPMKFEYIMDKEVSDKLELAFYLAPKIGDHDDDEDE